MSSPEFSYNQYIIKVWKSILSLAVLFTERFMFNYFIRRESKLFQKKVGEAFSMKHLFQIVSDKRGRKILPSVFHTLCKYIHMYCTWLLLTVYSLCSFSILCLYCFCKVLKVVSLLKYNLQDLGRLTHISQCTQMLQLPFSLPSKVHVF